MELRVKNALESVFAKLSALSSEELKQEIASYKDSELSTVLSGMYDFCRLVFDKFELHIAASDFELDYEKIAFDWVIPNASNDNSYALAA